MLRSWPAVLTKTGFLHQQSVRHPHLTPPVASSGRGRGSGALEDGVVTDATPPQTQLAVDGDELEGGPTVRACE